MAVIKSNTRVLCLMALLMISTTLLSIQASGRNIGLEANTGAVRSEANAGTEKNREPYLPPRAILNILMKLVRKISTKLGHAIKMMVVAGAARRHFPGAAEFFTKELTENKVMK
jgi:hypothetical protein